MALTTNWSKQLEFNVTLPSGYTTVVKIDAKLNSQSTANNTSNVSVRARIKYGYPWYAASPVKIRAGKGSGSGNYNEYTHTYTSSSKAPTTEITSTALWTGTITHNQDGTGTLPLYGYIYQKEWGVNKSKTGSVALPTIPRASTPTITPNPFNIGDTITITTNRKVQTYTDDLFMNIGSDVETLGTDVDTTIQVDTSQYANQFYALIPNTTSYTSTIDNSTYDGTTFIGSNSISYTANVVDAEPTFTLGYKDTNATTTAITGNNQQIIRNQSTLQINITNASALYGASLVSASVDINGNIYTGSFSGSSLNINVGTVDLSSNENAVVTVTDSRGLTTTKSVELQILDWQLPSAIIECARQNNYYTETNVKVDADYSSLDGNNTITITFKYKKTTDSTYTTTTLQDNVATVINMDNLYDWDIQVIVADAFGSTTYNLTLNKGVPLIFFDRKRESVSIGCFPQRDETIEVYGVDLLQDKQDTLVSGTNIKTINNTSLLGSGNINISGGGSATDVQINSTSITSGGTADIKVDGTYNASTNKIATMSSLPTGGNSASAVSTTASGGTATTYSKSDHVHNISSGTITSALGFTPANTSAIPTNTSDLTNDSGYITNSVNNLTNYSLTTDIQNNKNLAKGIEYIVGTQTASTNAWKGVSTDTGCSNSTMYVGKTIVYHLPYAGTSSAATLNLTLPDGTTTGAKNIRRQASSTVTTTFAADCDIFMIWNGTNWKVNAYYDSNSNSIGYQLRTNSAIYTNKTGYTSNRYTLLFEVDGGLSGAATTIGTKTTKTTVAFKYIPGGTIRYNSTNASVSNNADFTATGLWEQYAVNLRYTFNTGTTLTSGKPVYMRCVVNSDGTLTPNYAGTPSHPIVQALPSTADGYVYVFLGQAYSTSNIELLPNHPIYEFKDGKIRLWQYDTGGGGTSTDVQVNGTSITSGGVANLITESAYDSSTNKLATMSDIPNDNLIMDTTSTSVNIYDLSTGTYCFSNNITFRYDTGDFFEQQVNTISLNGGVIISVKTGEVTNDGITINLWNYDIYDNISNKVYQGQEMYVASYSLRMGNFVELATTADLPTGFTPYTEANIRVWTASNGVYKLPANCLVYYNGSSSNNSFSATSDSYIFITSSGSTTKSFTYLSGSTIYAGSTSSSTGTYNILVKNLTINSTSLTNSNGTIDIQTNTAYNSSTNKIATMSDIPTVPTDTGWQTLTLASGFSASSGSVASTPQYRKIGNHVFIRGTITFTRTSGTQIFATAASGYIPGAWVYKMVCIQGTRYARIGCNPSTGQMFIDWIYPANGTTAVTSGTITWLDITMDWFTD